MLDQSWHEQAEAEEHTVANQEAPMLPEQKAQACSVVSTFEKKILVFLPFYDL